MAMYDFTAGFSLHKQSGSRVRKDSLLDATVRGIRSFTEKDSVLQVFRMQDACDCFAQLRENHPAGERCLMYIEFQNVGWRVSLILLDAQLTPIKTTTKEVYGRRFRVQELDADVTQFMNGAVSRIL